jgi:enoyl-CoA hydratase
MTLDEVLDQDLRVGSRFLVHPDLAEGIRAMIIDKDRRPNWVPATLDEVTDTDVEAFFQPLGSAVTLA